MIGDFFAILAVAVCPKLFLHDSPWRRSARMGTISRPAVAWFGDPPLVTKVLSAGYLGAAPVVCSTGDSFEKLPGTCGKRLILQ